MTTIDSTRLTRHVYFHDAAAPVAQTVVPSVFVAVRGHFGSLLMVRRCDSGAWEMPGGRVDVGESAGEAAVREVLEEAGVQVLVTGIVGLFTDPGHVVSAASGEVRQQFVVVFGARWQRGVPRADRTETSEARWVTPAELPALQMDPPVRAWVHQALATDEPPYVG